MQRTMLDRIIRRMINSAIARAFLQWADWKRSRAMCRRVVARIVHQQLVAAFNCWVSL
eukprot:COSAG02_NODE_46627_length_347_cov_0.858871_1_plen_57_part_01